MNGTRVKEIFTENQCFRLKKHGVLHRVPGGKYIKPTPKAMEILNSQSSESLTTSQDLDGKAKNNV